ncbi:c-type cytochrome [Sulfitobacter geojensis]|uniref:c-type cytochrome n=1 Tax=Sulfitobacter geojensis TaxID=1342299 RepID=UPI0024900F8F|nr:cytochrome c [Sulfitobacter geojensis]
MRRALKGAAALGLIAAAGAWWLSAPAPLVADFASGHQPNVARGAQVFVASGCASCHAAPEAAEADKLLLSGGHAFVSDFGTFYAPNISPASTGIGDWTLTEFARAVTRGVSPTGQHYYPAFPYAAYQHMTEPDVADLFAYIQTLPVSDAANRPHDVAFPFNVRRALGLWKTLFVKDDFILTKAATPEIERGRYLVEGLAHCGECHTPRNALGGLESGAWLSGAPNPSGKGRIPDITPAALQWSQSDLVYYFESGLTPDYDSVGGAMTAVIDNLAQLPESDRAAIAAYLSALPTVP